MTIQVLRYFFDSRTILNKSPIYDRRQGAYQQAAAAMAEQMAPAWPAAMYGGGMYSGQLFANAASVAHATGSGSVGGLSVNSPMLGVQ